MLCAICSYLYAGMLYRYALCSYLYATASHLRLYEKPNVFWGLGSLGAACGASCGLVQVHHCTHLRFQLLPCTCRSNRSHTDADSENTEAGFMAAMTAPAPGQFDAQAPGVTAASGTAPERLESDLQSLEQQLAELQVCVDVYRAIFHFAPACLRTSGMVAVGLHRQLCLQVKVQQKRAEADSVAPYSRSFNRTLVGTLFSASGGLGLVRPTLALTLSLAQSYANSVNVSRHLAAFVQIDQDVRIGGWVKTGREAGGGSFAFLEVNDGSCLANLQVLAPQCQVMQCSFISSVSSAACSAIFRPYADMQPPTSCQ